MNAVSPTDCTQCWGSFTSFPTILKGFSKDSVIRLAFIWATERSSSSSSVFTSFKKKQSSHIKCHRYTQVKWLNRTPTTGWSPPRTVWFLPPPRDHLLRAREPPVCPRRLRRATLVSLAILKTHPFWRALKYWIRDILHNMQACQAYLQWKSGEVQSQRLWMYHEDQTTWPLAGKLTQKSPFSYPNYRFIKSHIFFEPTFLIGVSPFFFWAAISACVSGKRELCLTDWETFSETSDSTTQSLKYHR